MNIFSMESILSMKQRIAVRAGFSLLEVMISIAILGTVLTIMTANIYTLSLSRALQKEEAIVNELLRGIVERIQSETMANLGKLNENASSLYAWSWHRRMTPRWPATAPANPPLTQDLPTATIPANTSDVDKLRPFANTLMSVYAGDGTLISSGFLQEPAGINDLKVYLEYYRQEAFINEIAKSTNPQKTWRDICRSEGDYKNRNDLIYSDLAEGDDRIDFSLEDNPVVGVRIILTWASRDGGQRSRELMTIRRQ